MKVIDFHCDALYKLALDDSLSFQDGPALDVTLERLIQGNLAMQCFAIYIPESTARPSFYNILQAIDIFHSRVMSYPEMAHIRSPKDLKQAVMSQKIGALLTLEGVDGLEGDLSLVRHAYRLGVRMIGLTWNYANWAADGVLEPRQGGLTEKGIELVRECNKLGIILDTSHLCEASFWDVMRYASGPVIASHSNAYHICAHPRNLKDAQIRAIIDRGGLIGLTFVPYFLRSEGEAVVQDLVRHIDHVCSLGGAQHIVFGSDFDGISQWTKGLEHPGLYSQLVDTLIKYYKTEWVENFMYGNAFRFFTQYLPENE